MIALLAAAAPAAAQDDPAQLFAGAAADWSRESLAVRRFEDTPQQAPPRTASAVDAGSTFGWTRASLTFELGAAGGETIAWRVAARAGLAAVRLSQETDGGPRTVVASASDDGIVGGLSLGTRYRIGATGWWLGADYRLELGYAALDNATLFGGTPIQGAAAWLRHDAALTVGWSPGTAWSLFAGGRAVWSQLSTQWELAFEVPGVTRDTDADFTTRWPARWLIGAAFKTEAATITLEFSAGRLPSDVAASLRFNVKL